MKITTQAGILWLRKKKIDYKEPDINNYAIIVVSTPSGLGDLSIGLESIEIDERLENENKLYIVKEQENIVAFGWVGSKKAKFGKPEREVNIKESHRYLWDFVTFPDFRGKGIYPMLLKYIFFKEKAKFFWVLNHASNEASARGINKAGFEKFADIYFTEDSNLALVVEEKRDLTSEASQMLGIPTVFQNVQN